MRIAHAAPPPQQLLKYGPYTMDGLNTPWQEIIMQYSMARRGPLSSTVGIRSCRSALRPTPPSPFLCRSPQAYFFIDMFHCWYYDLDYLFIGHHLLTNSCVPVVLRKRILSPCSGSQRLLLS